LDRTYSNDVGCDALGFKWEDRGDYEPGEYGRRERGEEKGFEADHFSFCFSIVND